MPLSLLQKLLKSHNTTRRSQVLRTNYSRPEPQQCLALLWFTQGAAIQIFPTCTYSFYLRYYHSLRITVARLNNKTVAIAALVDYSKVIDDRGVRLIGVCE